MIASGNGKLRLAIDLGHAGKKTIICLCVVCLGGCVIVAAVPSSVIVTEVVPRAINGKGLSEDAADLATDKDCRVIEGIVRDDRQICEPRGSPATHKDFKGLVGLSEDEASSKAR